MKAQLEYRSSKDTFVTTENTTVEVSLTVCYEVLPMSFHNDREETELWDKWTVNGETVSDKRIRELLTTDQIESLDDALEDCSAPD